MSDAAAPPFWPEGRTYIPHPDEVRAEEPAETTPTYSRLGTLLTREQLGTLPKVTALVEGVLSSPAAVVLVGGYGLGKTVLAHALGCCVATGRPWLGRDVTRRRVLFVVGEGAYGLDERIAAWEEAWNDGNAVGQDQATFSVKPATLNNPATWKDITAYAVAGRYGFVILDTFSSLAADADETKDAAAIMRRLSDLSSAIKGTALLVHHPGWGDAGRTRGGYQFEANADEVLVMTPVSEGSPLVCVTRKKVKDGASGASLWINRVPLYGSVIFQHARPDEADVPIRSRILAVLGNYAQHGATGLQLSAELGITDKGRSGFYKSLRTVVDEGAVRAVGPRRSQRYYLTEHAPLESREELTCPSKINGVHSRVDSPRNSATQRTPLSPPLVHQPELNLSVNQSVSGP